MTSASGPGASARSSLHAASGHRRALVGEHRLGRVDEHLHGQHHLVGRGDEVLGGVGLGLGEALGERHQRGEPARGGAVDGVAPPHARIVGIDVGLTVEERIATRLPGIAHGQVFRLSTARFSSFRAVPMIIPAARRLMMPGSGIDRSTASS